MIGSPCNRFMQDCWGLVHFTLRLIMNRKLLLSLKGIYDQQNQIPCQEIEDGEAMVIASVTRAHDCIAMELLLFLFYSLILLQGNVAIKLVKLLWASWRPSTNSSAYRNPSFTTTSNTVFSEKVMRPDHYRKGSLFRVSIRKLCLCRLIFHSLEFCVPILKGSAYWLSDLQYNTSHQ